MAAVDEFVSKVLQARDKAHIAHWATKKYAEHVALGGFYADVLELLDGFVEQYQGAYNKRISPSLPGGESVQTIKPFLQAQVAWIEQNRYQVCHEPDTSLQNVIDEILGVYDKTLYLLTLE